MSTRHNRIAVLTGASSGLGRALAPLLIEDGYIVAGLARRAGDLAEIARALPAHTFIPSPCDVTDKNAVQHSIHALESQFGAIDLAIANAGISVSCPGTNFQSEAFYQTLMTNVMGAVYLYEAVIPGMMARKSGHLVSISSCAAYRGLPGAGAYSASKTALSNLTESLRLDLYNHHILVTLIHPGFIRTPLTDKNLYPMPFLLDTEAGVKVIWQAIKAKKRVVTFPWQMAFLVRLMRLLPAAWYDAIIRDFRNLKDETKYGIKSR